MEFESVREAINSFEASKLKKMKGSRAVKEPLFKHLQAAGNRDGSSKPVLSNLPLGN